jgi:hypothetical protein
MFYLKIILTKKKKIERLLFSDKKNFSFKKT